MAILSTPLGSVFSRKISSPPVQHGFKKGTQPHDNNRVVISVLLKRIENHRKN